MRKFKVGDKVVCINAEDKKHIKGGNIYTILIPTHPEFNDCLVLKEFPEIDYYKKRFILANSYIIKEKLGVK